MSYKVVVAGQQHFKAFLQALKGKGSLLKPQEQCIIVPLHHQTEALTTASFKHWVHLNKR